MEQIKSAAMIYVRAEAEKNIKSYCGDTESRAPCNSDTRSCGIKNKSRHGY